MRKSGIFYLITGVAMLLLYTLELDAQVYDFQVLQERVRGKQWISSSVTETGTMDTWVSSQNVNGSWDDQRYGTLSTSVTTKDNHLYRLWSIAVAASKTSHVRYNDSSYKNAVKIGLEYWYGSNTVDPNWWFNKIYFPQKLGEVLLLMRVFDGYIPQTSATGIDEPEVLSLFTPTSINDITSHGTGANAVDIARHYIYRGLLTENTSLLEQVRDRLNLTLTDKIEGDLVYQDHGPQIQISSYGWVYCDGLIRLAALLAGSPAEFDVNSTEFGTVLQFIRETQASSIRGRSWDFSVMGRAVSRPNALNGNLNYLQDVIDYIDPANASVYENILERVKGNNPATSNVREFNKHYWVSDYTQHARTEYLFAVRNTSTRTVEAETGNGENLKANYFSYGATFMSIDGDEYTNIMPVWDWSMIPGGTFAHTTNFPARSNWGYNYGTTTFVGGVSDGMHGAAVLDMNEAGTKAKKSWFFFENEMVCLGAGIANSSGLNVRTSVNQCWMKAPSYISTVGSTSETMQTVNGSTYQASNLKYIRQGKFGYFFPEQGNVNYTMKSQTGRWSDINSNQSTELKSGYVFALWFDHGTNPTNETYSYIVVPGIDSKSKADLYDAEAVQIISNSTAVQAVYHQVQDILQVVFHEAGSLVHGNNTITVNKPCALMVKGGNVVSVADPAQANSLIAVTINASGTEETKYVSLPTDAGAKGGTSTVQFDVSTDVDEATKSLELAFYPNPTEGISQLMVGEEHPMAYQVKDMAGKVVASGQFVKEATVDLSHCPAGLYVIVVSGKDRVKTRKVIKY